MTAPISLAEASERLGVHYMTAYRYVRTGRLPAHKAGGQWQVDVADLDSFIDVGETRAPRRDAVPERLADRLVAGDEPGAFQLLEDAMASGAAIDEVYLDLLGPAMVSIGTRWHEGTLTIADEHLATSTAQRVISRLGTRIATRGRSKGTVVVATVSDDYHALPTAMLRDLLRTRGYHVIDLGANTPPESLLSRALGTDELLAVGIAATKPDNHDIVRATLATLAEGIDVPVFVGGSAFASEDEIAALGTCVPTMSARHVLDVVDEIHAARTR